MKFTAMHADAYFKPQRIVLADPMFFFMVVAVLLALACTITLHNMLPRVGGAAHTSGAHGSALASTAVPSR